MNSTCKEINSALKIAAKFDNTIKEETTGWSNAKIVYYMQKKLTNDLKNEILLENPSLKYFTYQGSPHNKADEGFVCNECRIGISFPK